jgi:hypothetical protein
MLELRYTTLSSLKFLDGNSKLHDIGELVSLFESHGFREPLIWDKQADAIVSGNGRYEALLQLQKSGVEPPKNIQVIDGEWAVPVIYGGDAKTLEAAIAYSIDANLSVLGGGSFPVADRMKLFDTEALLEQLQHLAEMEVPPITFDGDDLDEMMRVMAGGLDEPDWDEHDATGTMGGDHRVGEKFVGFVLSDEQHSDWERGKEQMGVKDDKVFALKLLREFNG